MMGLLRAGVIYVVYHLVRQGGSRGRTTKKPPLEIARRRYASGEITREEFEQIKRDLRE